MMMMVLQMNLGSLCQVFDPVCKYLSCGACCSHMTRSLTAAKKHCRASATSGILSALHHAPYWMRHPRNVTADTGASSASSNVLTANNGEFGSADQETVVGNADDVFQPTASTSCLHDFGTELAVPTAYHPQMSASQCACGRSFRLDSCAKCAGGGKPISCEASASLSQSNCVEGHSATGENVHQRLHCFPSTVRNNDNMMVWLGPSECQQSACLRMSSASTVPDRPWVSE